MKKKIRLVNFVYWIHFYELKSYYVHTQPGMDPKILEDNPSRAKKLR